MADPDLGGEVFSGEEVAVIRRWLVAVMNHGENRRDKMHAGFALGVLDGSEAKSGGPRGWVYDRNAAGNWRKVDE